MDTISSHTNYIVAPPEAGIDPRLRKRISKLLSDTQVIREAHLPCVIELGQNAEAKPTLFVVVTDDCETDTLHQHLLRKLNSGFFKRTTVDVKVISDNFPLLPSIRNTNCLIGWRD